MGSRVTGSGTGCCQDRSGPVEHGLQPIAAHHQPTTVRGLDCSHRTLHRTVSDVKQAGGEDDHGLGRESAPTLGKSEHKDCLLYETALRNTTDNSVDNESVVRATSPTLTDLQCTGSHHSLAQPLSFHV